MIYITGDTHADFTRFGRKHFKDYKKMTKNDYMIICGDFGGIWDYLISGKSERYTLDWLNELPFTILFVDGNHENFDRLNADFPVVDYKGGKAHQISDNIYHLMRGYVFTIENKKFFAFGGASSHDIQDGIIDPTQYPSLTDAYQVYKANERKGMWQRIKYISWWEQELPTDEEMQRGIEELAKVNFEVDYVITHCLPQDVATMAGYFQPDILTNYFSALITEHHLKFTKWHCGHYHQEEQLMGKFVIHYENIERIN